MEIELPKGPEMVSASELFDTEEAGDIFYSHYKTGDISPCYSLASDGGHTADHETIHLRSQGTHCAHFVPAKLRLIA